MPSFITQRTPTRYQTLVNIRHTFATLNKHHSTPLAHTTSALRYIALVHDHWLVVLSADNVASLALFSIIFPALTYTYTAPLFQTTRYKIISVYLHSNTVHNTKLQLSRSFSEVIP